MLQVSLEILTNSLQTFCIKQIKHKKITKLFFFLESITFYNVFFCVRKFLCSFFFTFTLYYSFCFVSGVKNNYRNKIVRIICFLIYILKVYLNFINITAIIEYQLSSKSQKCNFLSTVWGWRCQIGEKI